jgi:hypothetical protein
MTWTCVECGLVDPYDGDGDGIGSCMCPRCDGCGECKPCADALRWHDSDACPDWDDDGYDPGYEPDDDGRAEAARWTPVKTLDVRGGLL